MKYLHKKAIFSTASMALFSSMMLIPTQASAAYQRCNLEREVALTDFTDPNFDLFSSNACQTPRVYVKANEVFRFYGAVCADNNKKNSIEAIIQIMKAPKASDPSKSYVATKLYKVTTEQSLEKDRSLRIVYGLFTVPVSGYYAAKISGIPEMQYDWVLKKPALITKSFKVRAIITNNPSEIPNQEHLKSLCDF